MNMPGAVYTCPPSSEKCTCQRSSRPGDENTVFIVGGCPPLRMPLFMMMTRGRNACTSGGEFEIASPWCEMMKRSAVPMRLFGHISSSSLFHVRSPSCTTRNLPNVIALPTERAFSLASGSCG